jgi:hypothetical protein
VRDSKREGGLQAALFLAALALAACSPGDEREETKAPAPRSGTLAVTGGGLPREAAYLLGDRVRLRGRGVRLDAVAAGPLLGTLTPLATPSPDGRLVAYNAWRGSRPLLRLYDLERDVDEVLAEGAHSVAWRRDGALAYFRAAEPDVDDPRRYLGHVVVRGSPREQERRWTPAPGRYVVAAWAGGRLLVYRLGAEFPALLVLDGPRRTRVLAEQTALLAVSPDGRRVLVAPYGASPPVVRLLDVADGQERAELALGSAVAWLLESGSWAGRTAVATAAPGLVVLSVESDKLTLEQVLRLPAAEFEAGVREPRLDASGRRFLAWAATTSRPRQPFPDAVLLSCDRLARRCLRGPTASSEAPPRPVYDPSGG